MKRYLTYLALFAMFLTLFIIFNKGEDYFGKKAKEADYNYYLKVTEVTRVSWGKVYVKSVYFYDDKDEDKEYRLYYLPYGVSYEKGECVEAYYSDGKMFSDPALIKDQSSFGKLRRYCFIGMIISAIGTVIMLLSPITDFLYSRIEE